MTILVFPRLAIEGCRRFTQWERASALLAEVGANWAWAPRDDAEESEEWVQAIPCALLRNPANEYCALRRVKDTRRDLRARITLLVGGHVDRLDAQDPTWGALGHTLLRELDEELGLQDIRSFKPLAIVIDQTSLASSQHVAFVHDVVTTQAVEAKASEEFMLRSKYAGAMMAASELVPLHDRLDPWSRIVFEDYLAPLHLLEVGKQLRLPLGLRA